MYTGKVKGKIVLSKKYPTLEGAKLLIVEVKGKGGRGSGKHVIAFDRLGATTGHDVFLVSAMEASFATGKDLCPVDESIIGIIDKTNRYG